LDELNNTVNKEEVILNEHQSNRRRNRLLHVGNASKTPTTLFRALELHWNSA
jgi:hypothetical protein